MYWYILKTIISSIIGSSFYNWFKDTRFGVWFQNTLDDAMDYVTEKYDIDLAKKEEKWFNQYPGLKARIEKLEDQAHYKCGIEDFDGYSDIDDRLKTLEEKSNATRKK